jgi:2-polyprenyl-6-methoxyphenol hydroxylase-like FAD-dependent oxidoreductase
MPIQQNQHAIVIGGSIAGLLAARVLSEYFQQVTIVDRDQLPMTAEPRRGVPQSVQPHVLFTKGYRILEALFPNIDDALVTAGAIPFDWGKDFLYFQAGRWSPTTKTPAGLKSYTFTRPLLESTIRQQVSKIANIDFLQGQRVIGLLSNGTAIQGVKFSNGELTAQLVVDASGRSTHVPQWLETLGITPPPATVIDPGLGYATRRYRIPSQFQPDGKILLISQVPPNQTRLGYLAQVENDQWIATLGGYAQDYPPIEEQDFLQFAQSLDHPAFYDAIAQAEPMSEIRAHRATMNRLYHYERIEMPEGLIAIGDAVCALCPIYGQGMTVSALASLVLQQWLAKSQKPNFQKQLARSNAFAWSLATASDSKFPTTKGAIASKQGARLFQIYLDRLMAAAQKDVEIHLAFLQMAHMLKPPSILFHPKLMLKVLF